MNFVELKKSIEEIPISNILEAWDPDALKGICPFHEDKHGGSFKYKDQGKKGGMFNCFCCDAKGDKVDFVMKIDGVDFKEANLRIARKFEKISEEEYKKQSKNPTTVSPVKVDIVKAKKIQEVTRHSDERLNKIYSAMKEELGLNLNHKEYLLQRGVPESELNDYFSLYPLNEHFWARMKSRGFDDKKFIGVPGFYVNSTGKVEMKALYGIAIPISNSKGLITSIQVRRDHINLTGEKKEARYKFLSSSGLNMGCSSGARVDVINPNKDGSIIITEGVFKAKEIARLYGITVISVQGVNNIKPLEEEIPELLKKREIRRFVIAYDADMQTNPNVKRAAKKLQKQLQLYEIPTGFMVWDEKFGKGADDAILAGHSSEFKFIKELD